MSDFNLLRPTACAGSIWIRIVVAAILAATSPFSMAVPFTLTPVGPIRTDGFQIATGLNDAGLVAGTTNPRNGPSDAFLWDSLSQTYIPLGALPPGMTSRGVNASINKVNNSSQLAGNLQGPGTTLPYLWQAGVTSQIPLLPGATSGVVENISDGGQVVGSNQLPSAISSNLDLTLPFIYTASGLNQLPLLPGMSHGLALDVNAQGDVVGLQQDLHRQQERAVAWISGVAVDLGFASADALAINNLGVVAAERNDALTRTFFLWQSGQVSDLFTARGGRFYDMNDSGDAVGSVVLPVVDKFPFRWDPVLGDGFAFLWDPVAGLLNLNDQIDPLSGWSLIEAHAINEHGQIAGRGKNPLGIEQGFLLTRTGEPFIVSRTNQIPEPTTLTLMTVGLAGIGYSKRRPKQDNMPPR